jgi:hypothetical protein
LVGLLSTQEHGADDDGVLASPEPSSASMEGSALASADQPALFNSAPLIGDENLKKLPLHPLR